MQTNIQDVLNALPTLVAYPAFLAGYRTVDEATSDRLFSSYLEVFIQQDMMPSGASSAMNHPDDSISQVVCRLTNSTDSLARLCSDGILKLPALILPNLLDLLAKNGDIHRLAFLIAAYGHYLSANADDKGIGHDSTASPLPHGDWSKVNNHDVVALLSTSPFASARLHTYSHFVAMYKSYRTQIAKYGVVFLLKQMAYNRSVAH